MSLLELARLMHDQKHFDKAIPYYERGIQAMEKVDAANKAPIGFADALDEYAHSLNETGNESEAKAILGRADEIRLRNPEGYSISDRTPYGTKCYQ
jgi:hypothetical protein